MEWCRRFVVARPVSWRINSNDFRMAVSIPNARQSTLRMPYTSRSSLSHSITVRFAIAAFSIGTNSHNDPRVMIMPPTC